MITIRCVSQPRFADGFIEEAVGELWEPWMREADLRGDGACAAGASCN